MLLNFQDNNDVIKGREKLEYYIKNGKTVDLIVKKKCLIIMKLLK